MVFLCRQVRWQNTSFNFAKRWHFVHSFLSVYVSTVGRPTLAPNVLELCLVRFETFSYRNITAKDTMFVAICKAKIIVPAKRPLLQMLCYPPALGKGAVSGWAFRTQSLWFFFHLVFLCRPFQFPMCNCHFHIPLYFSHNTLR